MALGHPYSGAAHCEVPGIPIGIDIETGRPYSFDPWAMKNAGMIHSTLAMFLGNKRHGKSASMKIIATRLMMTSAGNERMRVAINDYKPEGADSEYAAFSRYHNSRIFRIGDMSVNPFEAKLYQFSLPGSNLQQAHELGMLGAAESICEFSKGSRLDGEEHTTLRIALASMLRCNELLWSPQLLSKQLHAMAQQQVELYFGLLDAKLQHQMQARLDTVHDPVVREAIADDMKRIMDASNNQTVVDLQAAAERTAAYLDRVLHGSYGNMLGDKHSLYDMLTQRTITKDWRGVSQEAEQLMRILLTRIKISAIERNHLDLLPHMEIDDEQHRSMNLTYARDHSHFSEISRGVHTFSLTATHRLDSIRRGDVGSELYNLGDTIINNVGMVFIGKQVDNPKILNELRERYELTGIQASSLTALPAHTFLLKAGDETPRYINLIATPDDMTYLGTDSASERMTNRANAYDPESLQRYAAANGYELAAN